MDGRAGGNREQAPDTPAQLKSRALRLLAQRERTREELARKLAPHAESREALDALLRDLEARRLVSDDRFAETRARQLARKFGSVRIARDLRSRGVDEASVARQVDANRGDEIERAGAILRRKYRTPAATREERARRMRFLQGRGFGFDVIRAALGAVDSDPEDSQQ